MNMEAFALYLIKSTVWLSGFALVYALFLRNERFFTLNRIFLVSGILISIIFPFFTWHYTVVIPIVPTVDVSAPQIQGAVVPEESFSAQNIWLIFYLSGIIFLMYKFFRQTFPVLKVIRKSESKQVNSIKLILTTEYPASFSFISFVFVNPSIDEPEIREIVNHEAEHIRQKHWIDLLLFEILRTIQWFNPVIWLYGRMIRQNHEYLADEQALQRSSNPAVYRAALLNQMFGGPVISLANSFNYSLNKKRFTMMKHTIKSPFRKLKLLFVLPIIAGVFYAFSAPEYQFIQKQSDIIIQDGKTITGKVTDTDGDPLPGASVIVSGKSIGTQTDANGNFKLSLTDETPIFISFVGYETQKVNPDFEKEMSIQMKTAVIGIEVMGNDVSAQKKQSTPEPSLIIIDGKESTKAIMTSIKPEKIDKVDVLKGEMATKKYGKKGKDGVLEITLKPNDESANQALKIQANSPLKFADGEKTGKKPIYFVDGVLVNEFDIQKIKPETIESIDVLKGESAIKAYGIKGTDGVILIKLKKATSEIKNEPIDVKVAGYKSDQNAETPGKPNTGIAIRSNTNSEKPLVVLDGKIAEDQNLENINPETIESVNVIKNASGIEKYGDIGKNGVIEITSKPKSDVFVMVEEMPSFPGGISALKEYVATTMQYPAIALENGIQGKVIVNFVVRSNGTVTDAKIDRGLDPSLDKEALRIVSNMPKWKPGSQAGKPVKVSYSMPINFNLPAEYFSKHKESLKATSNTHTKATYTKSHPESKDSKTKPDVNQTTKTLQLIIVPNPTNDKATITLDGSDSNSKLTVSVFDSNGNLTKKEKKTGPTFTMSFAGLTSGMYLIVANDGTNQFSGQLVVNH